MIIRQSTPRYVVGEREFKTLGEAKEARLTELLNPVMSKDGCNYAQAILKQEKAVLDVLSTTETSLVKARAIHGGRKTRKPKLVVTAEQAIDKATQAEAANEPVQSSASA